MIELYLATLQNVSCLAGLYIAGFVIVRLIMWFNAVGEWRESEIEAIKRRAKQIKPFNWLFVVALILVCVPNMNQLWRIRIALITYQLASPENVTKSVETIERIGSKLECKYLGCEGKDE